MRSVRFFSVLVALVWGAVFAVERPVIIFNEDSDNVMRAFWHQDPNRYTEGEIRDYVRKVIGGGQVTHFFACVNARVSAYPSKVAPDYWAAVGQPGYKVDPWLAAMKDLVETRGVDQFSIYVEECRAKGVSPWLSFRMNDIHFPNQPELFLNVGFWKEHPELWNDPSASNRNDVAWGSKAFDYRKQAVQDHMLAYIDEALSRYDVDGIELDWMRFEHHAPRAVVRTEGARRINDFMRAAKALVARHAAARGHEILIAGRVDTEPEAALNHGTDYRTWAKEGLVNWLIACNFWRTVDFELPVAKWTQELAALNPAVRFFPGLDCGIELPGRGHRYLTADEYAAWGERMYSQGAKGVYFFNLFCLPSADKGASWSVWDLVLKDGFTPENVARHAKSLPENAPRECVLSGWYEPPAAAADLSLDGTWEFRREGGEWSGVTVPHDWAIAGAFDPTGNVDTAKLPCAGRGEYRRRFDLPSAEAAMLAAGGRAYLTFDGVQAHARVRVNGREAGGWDYGYVGFTLNVTDLVRAGENLVEVSADTTQLCSRWYPGGGIYRSVRLSVRPAEHVVPGTLAIVPEVARDGRTADVRVACVSSLFGPTNWSFRVENPHLWDVEDPFLYELKVFGERFSYGIRTMRLTADDGFWLNGRRLRLQGVCLHADLGPLGMAFDMRAARRQLSILKAMGVNAIRTAHNPPAPAFLDLCDRMGFVVWDEAFDKWDGTAAVGTANLEEYVARNLRAFVRRDRNHPCVAFWSIGNEIPLATASYPCGVTRERCRFFREAVRSEDATRPVGIGAWEAVTVPCFADLDVTGWNYARRYLPMRAAFPDKPIVYTESCSSFSDYGFYQLPLARSRTDYALKERRTDGYDLTAAGYSDIPDVEFHRMEKDGYVAGEFVWTGFDYLGEPSPYTPGFARVYFKDEKLAPTDYARSSYYGIVDLCGVPKDRYYLYRSVWNDREPTVHLLPHWNWQPGQKVPVMAYVSGDSAELFVNGRSLGRRTKRRDLDYPVDYDGHDNDLRGDVRENPYYRILGKYRLVWFEVPFEPGELRVVGFRNGKKIGEDRRLTAGAPAAVRIMRDPYSPGEGLHYLQIDVIDAAGVRVPTATDRIRFSMEGAGELVAVGNGDPRDHDSFGDTGSRRLYFGKAVAIVREPSGKPRAPWRLTATAEGLAHATFESR